VGRLTETSRQNLLRLARAAIARAIGAERVTPVADPLPNPQSLIPGGIRLPEDLRAGVFVTLRIAGQLRGCIGYPEPELLLVDAVERCAVSAAICDPRFPSVSVTEFCDIALEISVLGPVEPVGDLSEVVVGQHGLIVESGRCRGLLLPQVALEWNWNAAEFASETCVKAGLRRDAWTNGASLFKFRAEVFGEHTVSRAKTGD